MINVSQQKKAVTVKLQLIFTNNIGFKFCIRIMINPFSVLFIVQL